MGMIGEETAGEAYPVTNKEPETQTEKTGSHHETAMEPREFMPRKGKRQGERGGDQQHPANRADTENQKIENRPFRIVNGAEDEQRHGGGTCEAVNDAHEQRAQHVKKSQPRKESAQPLRFARGQPTRRSEAVSMMVLGRGVGVPVKMYLGIMFVKVGMFSRHTRMGRRELFTEPFHRAGEVEHAEQNQHQAYGKFHRQTDVHRNGQSK